jgi:methyltransferase
VNPIAAGVATLVALERLAEMWHAQRNTRALLAAGGVEAGRSHYPLVVALHASWLLAIVLVVPSEAAASAPLLLVFAILQGLRLWVLLSLGRYWTTRVITVPGAPLVRRGPYRFLRHPNYLVVAAEIAVLPLAFGAWTVALVFSALNAALLAWRISVEDRTLAPRRGIAQHPLTSHR